MVKYVSKIETKYKILDNSPEAGLARLLSLMIESGYFDVKKLIDILLGYKKYIPASFYCEDKGKIAYREPLRELRDGCVILSNCGKKRALHLAELAEKKHGGEYMVSRIYVGTKRDYFICRKDIIES